MSREFADRIAKEHGYKGWKHFEEEKKKAYGESTEKVLGFKEKDVKILVEGIFEYDTIEDAVEYAKHHYIPAVSLEEHERIVNAEREKYYEIINEFANKIVAYRQRELKSEQYWITKKQLHCLVGWEHSATRASLADEIIQKQKRVESDEGQMHVGNLQV